MFGNVTAQVGLHVTGKYRTEACSTHAPGMRPGILTRPGFESGPLRAVHLSRHKWPGGSVKYQVSHTVPCTTVGCCTASRCEWSVNPTHTVECDPFIKSHTIDFRASCVVQDWSRGGHVPLRIEGNETRVLHHVDTGVPRS